MNEFRYRFLHLLDEIRECTINEKYTDADVEQLLNEVSSLFANGSPLAGCRKDEGRALDRKTFYCWFLGWWILHLKESEAARLSIHPP